MVELAVVTLALSVLVSVTLALLLESHMQIIELAGVIFAFLIKVLVDVIFAHLFKDRLTWVYSS